MEAIEKRIAEIKEIDMSKKEAPFMVYEMKYTELEEAIKVLEKEKEVLKNEILAKFEEVYGHEGVSVKSEITGNTLQRIIAINKTIDEDKVKKVVSEDIWEKITSRKINRDNFFAAIKMGIIKAMDVSHAIETKEVDKLAVRKEK